MVLFQVAELKKFMSMLLAGTAFDRWELSEAKAETFCEFRVNGRLKKEFFDTDEEEERNREYAKWGEVKPVFYQAIKGNKLPLSFSVVLCLPKEESGPDLKCFLNIRYTKQGCFITTGAAREGFSLERGAEAEWDKAARERFRQMGIVLLEIE